MNEKQQKLVKSILGDDFFMTLEKSEITGGIIKINTNTATDPEEIKIALQIVPRAILSFLFLHLKDHPTTEPIKLELPFVDGGLLMAKKHGADNYSGEFIKDGKRAAEFKFRSLPGIGLILMSTFELYDLSQLDEIKQDEQKSPEANKLQDLIDERLYLHNLVESVVSKKIMEKDAINQMIQARLTQHIEQVNSQNEESEEMKESNKNSKLKGFLESRKDKDVSLDKSELTCCDCGTTLRKNTNYIELCVCFGEYMGKKLKIQKNENGQIKLKFPKDFGVDNAQMLLDTLKVSNEDM